MKSIDPQRLARASILAVDDSEAQLNLMRRVLERAGYTRFRGITDPFGVRGAMEEEAPDILLLDLQMPGRSGIEVIAALQPLLAGDDLLPILVISGDLDPASRQAALALGARDFLAKPFDVTEAVLRIRNLLEVRFLYQELRRDNRDLEARVAERTQQLERAHVEVLERLAQAAEVRDDETGDHTRRVGALAASLAAVLGHAPEWVEMLRQAAPLHDLGKIGIPDAMLRKPGPLSPEERRVMETHAALGARILAHGWSPLVRMAERVAWAHHERWDGTGYPRGLAGAEIPLEARIVAVADVFDALTRHRPYRPGWSEEEALDEIRRGAGSHFDPEIVRAFLESRARGAGPGSPAVPAPGAPPSFRPSRRERSTRPSRAGSRPRRLLRTSNEGASPVPGEEPS